MFSTTLTTQFGKIFANILRDFIRIDGIVSRDTMHIRASCMKCCVNNDSNGEQQSLNNNLINTTKNNVANNISSCADAKNAPKNEKQLCCLFSGKSDTSLPLSSFELAKSLTSMDRKNLANEFRSARTLNDTIRAQKRFLNATTDLGVQQQQKPLKTDRLFLNATTATKSFIRAMSMLNTRPVMTVPKTVDAPSFKLPKRWYSPKVNNRANCAEWCGEDTCNLNRPDTKVKKSMWVTADCYGRCKKPFRYDVIFMPGSDKASREYQQTWIECPPIRIVKKPVCCFEPHCLPPICRRPRKVPRMLPGKSGNGTCGINTCKEQGNPDCIKIREPCCIQKAREVPCCKIYPTPSCCQKRCTPYPSFSECCKPEFNRKGPIECLCLVKPTMCEVWADWRKKNLPGQYEDL